MKTAGGPFLIVAAVFSMLGQALSGTEEPYSGQGGPQVVLKKVVQALHARELLFESCYAKIDVISYKNADALRDRTAFGEEHLWFQRSGIARKVEITASSSSGKSRLYQAVTWNGSLGKTWIKDLNSAGPGSGRVVLSPPAYINIAYPEQYMTGFDGKSWSAILEQLQPVGLKITGEGGLTLLEHVYKKGSSTFVLTVSLDNERFLAPSRWKLESWDGVAGHPRRCLSEFTVEEWSDYGGAWIPRVLRRVTFQGHILIANIEVGFVGGAARDLDITWSPGTSVWDEASNRGFFVP